MAVSHLGLGLYFHFSNCSSNTKPDPLSEESRNQTHFNADEEEDEVVLGPSCQISWLPLPLILGFTVAFNLGLGSLNLLLGVVATGRPEIPDARLVGSVGGQQTDNVGLQAPTGRGERADGGGKDGTGVP